MSDARSFLAVQSSLLDCSSIDILIVDDMPNNLRLLATLLERQGYSVRKALDGDMAITAANVSCPDLILLDIMMPGMNGYDVCRHLKDNPKTVEVPVIFLTALNEVFDKVKAFEVGGADYITKPFQIEEVLIRIKNQIMLKVAERQLRNVNAELERRVQERTQELQAANAKLLDMAHHDLLTGLPNRTRFMQCLETLLHDYHQGGSTFSVLFLDCDRFKVVNDSLGHSFGDAVLLHLSQRLQNQLSSTDVLARLGGDEFAILLPNIVEQEAAIAKTELLLESLTEPFQINGREIFLDASVGIVLVHEDYTQPEYILRDADTAMYRAKASRSQQYHVFDVSMHQAVLQRLLIEVDLRKAIENQELILFYQPIVCLQTGCMTGTEALLRWNHSHHGLLSPDQFIPLAEETGLIGPIGRWVLSESCRQLHEWQEQGLVGQDFTMSVNLSAHHFHEPDLIAYIDQVLAMTHICPHNLDLEITETVIMDGLKHAMAMLRQLKQRQIKLSLDDFGTGFSSLSYLHSFPFDVLKIDKSFIRRLDGTKDPSTNLVPAIMAIAQTMNIQVIAEGIESASQLRELQALHCGLGQGYLFAKPMDATRIQPLLSQRLFTSTA